MENTDQQTRKRFSGSMGPKIGRVFGWTFMGIVFISLFALVFGFVVKWLWNALMPAVFGLGVITFWQAVALVILAKLLFGSFGGHPNSKRKFRPDDGQGCDWHPPWNRFGGKRESMGDRFRDWKYYHRFWEDEGKEAFNAYVAKKKAKYNNDIQDSLSE